MNTKYVMVLSAVVTGFLGLAASFFPSKILQLIGVKAAELPTLIVQVAGALYLGFAVMNWMAKTILIGGIYARPLGIGNCLQFTLVALALLKFTLKGQHSIYAWVATIVYLMFAVLFGLIVFTNPKQVSARSIQAGESKLGT